MINDLPLRPGNVRVDQVNHLSKFHTTVDVLRLDLLHDVISGNKWYKLKKYLEDARALDKKIIVTFGGAYSNHIVATAAAARQNNFKSIGIIRGERPASLSMTLQNAVDYGMDLYFLSREAYKKKIIPPEIFTRYDENEIYFVNEGGYGPKGMEGAKDILHGIDPAAYTHVFAAVGTGTTLAGLTEASGSEQKIIGISVLKNNFSLQQEILSLISAEKVQRFTLVQDYHFGGYAKHSKQLIDFMNHWYELTGIPSDFVYTAKLFFAAGDLLQRNYFPEGSKLLLIHSGGLQGNRSLPKGTLIF